MLQTHKINVGLYSIASEFDIFHRHEFYMFMLIT